MLRVEVIEWIDAVGKSDEAHYPDEMENSLLLSSVGIFVKEDDEAVTIAMDSYPDGRYRSWASIPKVCIKNRITKRA